MKLIFIGHRGVGKSTCLKAFSNDFCYDLDHEIEKQIGKSVSDIFQEYGEEHFRELENKYFKALIQKPKYIISLGAGAQVKIPQEARVFWVQRQTDTIGRIFTDRPRLNSALSPLEEYFARFEKREKQYQQQSNETLLLPEGNFNLSDFINTYTKNNIDLKNYALTLHQEHIQKEFLNKRLQQNIEYFEIRDDILSYSEYQKVLETTDKLLLSFRTKNSYLKFNSKFITDWAIELGSPDFEPSIVSVHKTELLDQAMSYEEGSHIKWSPLVNSWKELIEGHNWWLKSPQTRSFLPRSNNGKWYWYRLMWGHKMKVKFYKENRLGSATDQPSLYQVHNFDQNKKESYGVIGEPVLHSWTPEFHKHFFKTNGYAIEVSEKEFHFALENLKNWSVNYLAVTSPLKNIFSEQPVNTLVHTNNEWKSTNTDIVGFKKILTKYNDCGLWGGGGIRSMVKQEFPELSLFSSRTGKCLNNSENIQPKCLIWAVPNKYAIYEPSWNPDIIIDLNYFENSKARSYALKVGAQYVSGADFFINQAKAQQEFWSSY